MHQNEAGRWYKEATLTLGGCFFQFRKDGEVIIKTPYSVNLTAIKELRHLTKEYKLKIKPKDWVKEGKNWQCRGLKTGPIPMMATGVVIKEPDKDWLDHEDTWLWIFQQRVVAKNWRSEREYDKSDLKRICRVPYMAFKRYVTRVHGLTEKNFDEWYISQLPIRIDRLNRN
jgi:hypothetical protein